MIDQLSLKNFQSHKSSRFVFDKGVNIIIGPSDKGKSAVIRALKLVIWNQPNGDSYRSWWGGDTRVEVLVDANTIERRRTNSFNGYIVNASSEFSAIKTDVPDEIKELLNMNEVNLQQQLDSAFLLSSTSGEVARYFNKVANLDKIDLGTSNITTWINKLKTEISYKENDYSANKQKLATFDYLEKFEIDVEVLEETERQLTNKQNKKKQLKLLVSKMVSLKDEIVEEEKLASLSPLLTNVLAFIEKKKDECQRWTRLSRLLNDYIAVCFHIEENKVLQSMGKSVDSFLALYRTKESTSIEADRLKKHVAKMKMCERDISITNAEMKTKHTLFESEMGDVCLLCGQTIKH